MHVYSLQGFTSPIQLSWEKLCLVKSSTAKFPKFKKKRNKQSVRFPQGVKVEGDFAYLPKIGWVRVNFHRPIEGKIKSVTVSKTKTGKCFISFVCEVKDPKPEYKGSEIGIDVGLKTFEVTSDGKSVL